MRSKGGSEGRRSKAAVMKGGLPYWFAAVVLSVLVLAALAFAGCGGGSTTTTAADTTTTAAESTTTSEATTTTVKPSDIILASTTSTQDSGLFDVLLPAFAKAYPQYTVQVIAVGSGEAIKLGEQKDADVLLVHSPAAEKDFVANGFGTERRLVMYNDFVLVGPESDPAGVKGMTDAASAFAKVAAAKARFISRGDKSGTNTKELGIWKAAAIEPAGDWYESIGQGMGEALRISSERQGYTLSDRATFLNLKDTLELVVLVEGDKAMFNQYGVIPVTDATNAQGAQDFADWITSAEGQAVIKGYGVEKFGQPLFVPNAGSEG
ncbi:MAG TPA: substrate-binding domain-containing protein [Thermoleophilia bacterium]|nr:substrate-binding domain-containing protein [Thermoleophilia bacterium]